MNSPRDVPDSAAVTTADGSSTVTSAVCTNCCSEPGNASPLLPLLTQADVVDATGTTAAHSVHGYGTAYADSGAVRFTALPHTMSNTAAVLLLHTVTSPWLPTAFVTQP